MASQDPLDILQLMVNDVLVQTGKALRASRRDGQGNVAQAHGSLQSKLPDTIRTFHSALDDLENEIIQAKSVILRDLTQIQNQKQQQLQHQQQQREAQAQAHQPSQPAQQPQPVEPQSKEPMVIDLDSSPPPPDPPITESKPTKPVAPFPDMGMGLTDMGQTSVVLKEETPPAMPPAIGPEVGAQLKSGPIASPAPMAPMPDMDDKPVDINMDISGGDLSAQDLNFTDMEFSLAPTNNDNQVASTSQGSSFDLTTFAPAENGDDLLTLENLLPSNPNDQPNNAPVTQTSAPDNIAKMELGEGMPDATNPESLLTQDLTAPKKEETGDTTFEDILMDTGTDFGAGGGLGEDTFNDLIADRDETFDLMEHGDFDASYFGLDNTDET